MLISWDKLPVEMQNEQVRKYYDILSSKKSSLICKRIFDIVASLMLIIILLWLFIILAVCIKIDSKGPVFYRQVRVTQNNRDFKILKFRTMIQNADKIGSLVTVGNDKRITRVGSKIRKVRLDELPQLFNILIGDMSFVGTRPEVRKYVDKYTDEMMATLLLPAGVTSLASIMYKDEDHIITEKIETGMRVDEAYMEYVLPNKMKYNLEAIREFSFYSEIKLMFKTVIEVFK